MAGFKRSPAIIDGPDLFIGSTLFFKFLCDTILYSFKALSSCIILDVSTVGDSSRVNSNNTFLSAWLYRETYVSTLLPLPSISPSITRPPGTFTFMSKAPVLVFTPTIVKSFDEISSNSSCA